MSKLNGLEIENIRGYDPKKTLAENITYMVDEGYITDDEIMYRGEYELEYSVNVLHTVIVQADNLKLAIEKGQRETEKLANDLCRNSDPYYYPVIELCKNDRFKKYKKSEPFYLD